ncbi:DUF3306 domain-containing protein [Pigmentiphaga sp. H8]|uniref:DUF3306 domain-containing protein n=1 Tax=unclassified Pigmentiphaga TaxID=2626614 RepID=UPI000F5A360D|nr:DUF3306 domain-containing protein [Pigmentiphaga sp. H8]AZG07335.1 DUF3306 domain-containing protein [Pigmentiphaga sp. H8]
MNDDGAGFLGRWSRRKAQSRTSTDERAADAGPAPEAGPDPRDAAPGVPAMSSTHARPADETPAPGPGAAHAPDTADQPPPAPTREDLAALTHDSDFSPFMQAAVEPDVKLAALKKLFSDPHYNVMDGLDVYIDDYSSPEKLPESTLRQMVSARVLALVQDDPAPPSGDPAPGHDPASEAPADDDAQGSVLESGASTGHTPSDGQTHFDFPEPDPSR